MFTALKRLTGKGDGQGPPAMSPVTRPGHQSMSHNLQRKFARGVQYNMKIIIKGDRNVGKTALFHRLKGEKFFEEYIPTEEIQVASIQWSYKATDDVVKVEVWDVVDRGKKKRRVDGLKLENAGPASSDDVSEEPVLDAEFLDVYKGTNGVIMVMDITKNWTFEYVQRELPKVPAHIPVLVLANHCDMSHHRVITPDHVTYFIESQQRPGGCAQIRYAESSMRNGFGLKFLHKFLNLPFLQLQRETLLAQLETNANEAANTMNELDMFQSGPDADYNQFLENLVNKRRQAAESVSMAGMQAQSFSGLGHASAGTTGNQQSSGSHQLSSHIAPTAQSGDSSMRRSSSTPGQIGAGQPIGAGHPIGGGHPIGPIGGGQPIPYSSSNKVDGPVLPSQPVSTSSVTLPRVEDSVGATSTSDSSKKPSGFMAKIFGKKESVENERQQSLPLGGNDGASGNVVSVEEFVPDGGMIDRSFLEDASTSHGQHSAQSQPTVDSDSDNEPSGNPLVAGFQDDIDSDEDLCTPLKGFTVADVEAEDEEDEIDSIAQIQEPQLSTHSRSPSPKLVTRECCADTQDVSSVDGEVSTITGDALDAWFSVDSKWRRSPEGGEDSGSRGSHGSRDTDLDASSMSVSGNVEKKKKDRQKEKVEEKSTAKKHKKKSKDKEKDKSVDKEKEKKKKKSSRKLHSEERSRDELEEFLNGSSVTPVESAYEAL